MTGSRTRSRRRTVVGVVFLALVTLLVVQPGFFAADPPDSADEPLRDEMDVRLVSPHPDSDVRLWPFTSRAKSFDSLTLPINVVVRDEASRVISQLRTGGQESWDRDAHEWQGVGDESGSVVTDGSSNAWLDTTGATRYTYVDRPGDSGRWLTETAQLHRGSYFGSRYHLRLYEGGRGDGTWTAIQAHHEHWDPFRLRHTVGSLSIAQHQFERQYYGKPYVTDISRERFANGGIFDADGWVTVIDLRPQSLAPVGLVFLGATLAVGASRSPFRTLRSALSSSAGQRGVTLGVVLLSLPVVIRNASIAVENTAPAVPVKAIAAVGYLLFAVGLPLAAVLLPTEGHTFDWFGLSVVALGIGFLLDYQQIGIEMLPVTVVLHRLAVLVAVGVLAVGSRRPGAYGRWNVPTVGGALLWVIVLAWPLVDVL